MRIDTVSFQRTYGGESAARVSHLQSGFSMNISLTDIKDRLSISSSADSSAKVITSRERNFFIQMFPESSIQLEQHELFTRNGKLTSVAAGKGTIIDGRI